MVTVSLLPYPGFLIIISNTPFPVHHLCCKHLALCFATCMELSHAAALPTKFICFCWRKTFLLHFSKHTAEGKHPLSSCLGRQNWLISRLQSEKFCSECGHFTGDFVSLLQKNTPKLKPKQNLFSKTRCYFLSHSCCFICLRHQNTELFPAPD